MSTVKKEVAHLTFEEWIDPYFSLTPKPERGRQRFEAFQELCAALGHPERALPAIHIAGTNGKGSVATIVSRALWHGGIRVGAFTSPHLRHFSERIWACGHFVAEKWVRENGNLLFEQCERLGFSLGFFEWSFLLALRFFLESKVDVMVIEAGIGGALDTTNVVNPILSAITSVGLDHQNILGSTIDQIGRDKAGIFKPSVPVIIGPHVPEIVEEIAKSKGCHCVRIEPAQTFMEENQGVAEAILKSLPDAFFVDEKIIFQALKIKAFGRMQVLENNLILDVAHNGDAVMRVVPCLENYFKALFSVVICFTKDKDIKACLAPLIGKVSFFHVTFFKHSRCAKKEAFEKAFEELGIKNYAFYLEVKEGLRVALEGPGAKVAILGSFYLAAECLTFLDKK